MNWREEKADIKTKEEGKEREQQEEKKSFFAYDS